MHFIWIWWVKCVGENEVRTKSERHKIILIQFVQLQSIATSALFPSKYVLNQNYGEFIWKYKCEYIKTSEWSSQDPELEPNKGGGNSLLDQVPKPETNWNSVFVLNFFVL